jgi:hypothetical protein
MAHVYNLGCLGNGHRKIDVQGQLGKKVSETLSEKTNWVWWSTSVIPARQEAQVGESWSEVGLDKKRETLSKK